MIMLGFVMKSRAGMSFLGNSDSSKSMASDRNDRVAFWQSRVRAASDCDDVDDSTARGGWFAWRVGLSPVLPRTGMNVCLHPNSRKPQQKQRQEEQRQQEQRREPKQDDSRSEASQHRRCFSQLAVVPVPCRLEFFTDRPDFQVHSRSTHPEHGWAVPRARSATFHLDISFWEVHICKHCRISSEEPARARARSDWLDLSPAHQYQHNKTTRLVSGLFLVQVKGPPAPAIDPVV